MQYLIFTDLDGTLISHEDYRYSPVPAKIVELKLSHVPVFLNSSKTFAELKAWQKRLGAEPLVICENGGVIVNVKTSKAELIGRPYEEICRVLDELRITRHFKFSGFHDWTLNTLISQTQLSAEDATLAQKRQVTEPIVWEDSESALEAFRHALDQQGLQLQKGGRFFHVMGHHDKAVALKKVAKDYLSQKELSSSSYKVIALGDSGNDLKMLQSADFPIVLPGRDGSYLNIHKRNQIHASHPAPDGWVEAIDALRLNGDCAFQSVS